MTKVIIAGAAGRMGRRIGYMVHEHKGLEVAAGFEVPDNPEIGRDMGELGGYGTIGVPVADDLGASAKTVTRGLKYARDEQWIETEAGDGKNRQILVPGPLLEDAP